MSFENLVGDLIHGNFSNAWTRLQDFWNTLPAPVRSFVGNLGTDEGKILQGLVNTALPDLEKNGFTTAGFVATGKDILAQLVAQNITTFTLQHVIATINIAASPLVASASTAPANTVAGS